MMKGARFFDEIYAASGSGRLLLVDDLFTRQVAGQFGVHGTWLQPVLMKARDRRLLSQADYAKAITDLIDAGQSFVSIDPQTLLAARRLDREAGEAGPGRCLSLASRSLGGRHADINSHCRVAIEFLRRLWAARHLELSDYAAISQLLRSLLRERTADYQGILFGTGPLCGGARLRDLPARMGARPLPSVAVSRARDRPPDTSSLRLFVLSRQRPVERTRPCGKQPTGIDTERYDGRPTRRGGGRHHSGGQFLGMLRGPISAVAGNNSVNQRHERAYCEHPASTNASRFPGETDRYGVRAEDHANSAPFVGGTFNPIIPVFRKPPAEWRPQKFERLKGLDVAKGYVRFFKPDVYVEAETRTGLPGGCRARCAARAARDGAFRRVARRFARGA